MKILKSTFVNNEPLSITDLYNSKSDEAAVVDYITGSAIRGAVMNRLADQGVLAGDVKKAMFDGSVCFGNAYPILVDSDYNKFETIPTPRGFYENRDQSGAIRHAFAQNRDSQMKRAKVGSFASLALENEHKLLYTTPLEGEIFKTRLARNNTDKSRDKEEAKQALFRGSYLEKNQTFCGRIFFSDACSDEICKLIETELNHPGLQLGGMRSAGHGGVTVIAEWDAPADTKHLDKILAQKKSEDGFFYMDMICLSNMCMVNQYGEPCGMNGIEIAEKLHLTECGFECVDYATSVTHYCSFNRIAGGRSPELPVFEGGGMFRFRTKKLPTVDLITCDMTTEEGRKNWGNLAAAKSMDICEDIRKVEIENESSLEFAMNVVFDEAILVKGDQVNQSVIEKITGIRFKEGERLPDKMQLMDGMNRFIIPGSSTKGVFRNHMEKIMKYCGLDAVSERGEKSLGDKIFEDRSHLFFYDSFIGGGMNLQVRTRINKFTGSVMDKALFKEAVNGGSNAESTIKIRLYKKNLSEVEIKKITALLFMTMRDCAIGIVSLGSGYNVGRGFMTVNSMSLSDGEKKLAELQIKKNADKNTYECKGTGMDYITSCLNALKQGEVS